MSARERRRRRSSCTRRRRLASAQCRVIRVPRPPLSFSRPAPSLLPPTGPDRPVIVHHDQTVVRQLADQDDQTAVRRSKERSGGGQTVRGTVRRRSDGQRNGHTAIRRSEERSTAVRRERRWRQRSILQQPGPMTRTRCTVALDKRRDIQIAAVHGPAVRRYRAGRRVPPVPPRHDRSDRAIC